MIAPRPVAKSAFAGPPAEKLAHRASRGMMRGMMLTTFTLPKPTVVRMGVLACLLSLVGAVCCGAAEVSDPSGLVTISGGADTSGHNYTWTVTNDYTEPIVRVSFPHFRADLFMAPPGWETDTTNLNKIGVNDPRGVCTGTAPSASTGIVRGRSADFQMRIAAEGAHRKPGRVTVAFADGREVVVAGVELPQVESKGQQYMPAIGLGLIFGLFLLMAWWRNRGRPAKSADVPPAKPQA